MNVKPIFGSSELRAAAKVFKEKLPSAKQLSNALQGELPD
jgi:hypothetical protein